MNETGIKKIAVLGAGWLGMPLGRQLASTGYEVNGSTTSSEKMPLIQAAGMSPFLITIGESIEGSSAEQFFEVDLLIVNIPPRRRIPNIEERYPNQMRAILSAIQSSPIRYCIFVSSTSVYGNYNELVTEESSLAPTTGSGKALVQSERLFMDHPDFRCTVLRMAGLAGANRKLGRFLAGKKDLPNPSAPVNLIHLEDCIGVIQAVINKQAWGEIYNVCTDQHPAKKALYTAQAEALGLEAPTFNEAANANFKIVSNQKLKDQLGYVFLKPDPFKF